jgi:hypothetical protein
MMAWTLTPFLSVTSISRWMLPTRFSTVMDTSNDWDGFANVVPHTMVEVLRTAKEKHLHLAVS